MKALGEGVAVLTDSAWMTVLGCLLHGDHRHLDELDWALVVPHGLAQVQDLKVKNKQDPVEVGA